MSSNCDNLLTPSSSSSPPLSSSCSSSCSSSSPSSPSSSLSSLCQSSVSTSVVLETVLITAVVTCAFVITKSTYDRMRLLTSRATVVIIGAGPAGLISAWIVAQTGKASRVIVYEERTRSDVVNRTKYMALNGRSLKFLRGVGLELQENVEGSCQHQGFVMRTGPFLEYVLDMLKTRYDGLLDLRIGTKFTKDCLKELDAISERIVAIVCDGSCGRSASLLGLSDEYTQHSCRAYGAVATIDRPPPQPIGPSSSSAAAPPTDPPCPAILPEIRVHHLTIDLNSHCRESFGGQNDPFPTSFHLKIFGCGGVGQRSMALAVPRCESTIVRTLKVILDQSVMRNIFQECYNKYRLSCEASLSDSAAIKCIKFSPRLFEIKLLQRMEAAAYIEDADIFVVSEGLAARRVNFDSGMDINLVISGLATLGCFVQEAVWVNSEQTILQALTKKLKHGQSVSQDFVRNGLKEFMYT